MRQWCAADLPPAGFWDETPASYAAAMRGRSDAARERYELALFTAWRTEAFAREDKLRPVKTYLQQQRRPATSDGRQTPAEMAASLGQRAGAVVEIVDAPRPKGM